MATTVDYQEIGVAEAEKRPQLLNARFGLVQIIYWFGNCAVVGFAAVYLLQFGLSNVTTGLLIAGASLVTCVLQPLLGEFADRTTRFSLKQIVCGMSVAGAVVSAGLDINTSTVGALVLYSLATVLVVTVQPFINALGLAHNKRINFGLARGLGSTAYALSAVVVGMVVASIGPALVDNVMLVCWIMLFGVTLLFPSPCRDVSSQAPERETTSLKNPTTFLQFFGRYKTLCLVLAGAFFAVLSHMGINIFFIKIVEGVGGSSASMGIAVAIAALVELPVMALYVVLRRRFSCQTLLVVSTVGFLVKALVTWTAPTVELVFAAQILQALAFALYLPAIIDYAKITTAQADAVKAQALVLTVQTFSYVVAGFVGGALLEVAGLNAIMVLWCVTAGMGVMAIVLLFAVERKKRGRLCT